MQLVNGWVDILSWHGLPKRMLAAMLPMQCSNKDGVRKLVVNGNRVPLAGTQASWVSRHLCPLWFPGRSPLAGPQASGVTATRCHVYSAVGDGTVGTAPPPLGPRSGSATNAPVSIDSCTDKRSCRAECRAAGRQGRRLARSASLTTDCAPYIRQKWASAPKLSWPWPWRHLTLRHSSSKA